MVRNSRDILEQIGDRASVPEPAYERLLWRRERRRRNDHIAGLVVGLLVLALLGTAFVVGSRDRTSQVPGERTPSPVALPGPLSNEFVDGIDERRQPGRYWLSRGDLFVSFDVPAGWRSLGALAVLGPGRTAVSFWFVDRVAVDPCHWKGSWRDPGTSVDQLVQALSVQPGAGPAEETTLAGFDGRVMQLRVPSAVAKDADRFRSCDPLTSREGTVKKYFTWWMGDVGFAHWPNQIDRLWILDVNGERLVIDAEWFPGTSERTRTEILNVVDSIGIT